MEREKLDFAISSNNYLKGGTKEACVKIREVLTNKMNPGNQLHAPLSCVTIDEFTEAVEILMASAFKKEDEIPERWNCDGDCIKTSYILCPGECSIDKTSKKTCPFLSDEGNL